MNNLKKQFLNRNTALSFLISFLILYWIFSKLDFYLLLNSIKNINLFWFFVAFGCFYASVCLKGIRWKLLLNDAELEIKLKDSILIFYLSMFANSIVPAKIGDVYRSYLLKQKNEAPISLSFATVFIERIFDLMTMIPLLLIFGIISFNANIPLEILLALKYGLVLIVLVIGFTLIFLKLNAKFMKKIDNKIIKNIFTNFEKGIRTLKVKSIPKLFLLSLTAWITEGFTIYFIFLSIGLNFDILFSIFTDLSSSLLTAIPFTPSGLGVVEYALLFILNLKNTGLTESSVVIVLYRIISYFSIVFLGSIMHFMYGLKKWWHIYE